MIEWVNRWIELVLRLDLNLKVALALSNNFVLGKNLALSKNKLKEENTQSIKDVEEHNMSCITPEAIRLSYEMTCFNYANHTALLMVHKFDALHHRVSHTQTTTCTHPSHHCSHIPISHSFPFISHSSHFSMREWFLLPRAHQPLCHLIRDRNWS